MRQLIAGFQTNNSKSDDAPHMGSDQFLANIPMAQPQHSWDFIRNRLIATWGNQEVPIMDHYHTYFADEIKFLEKVVTDNRIPEGNLDILLVWLPRLRRWEEVSKT